MPRPENADQRSFFEQGQSPDASAVREQLERILASGHFAAAGRMGRFLRFIVEALLDGRSAGLKEFIIGVEVFDRPADYDPRLDPIVRVEARRLREKLKAFYETEGPGDRIVIQVPRGTYVPVLAERAGPNLAAADKQAKPKRVAVLPFVNLTSDPEFEYFSDGLTAELIHRLTKTGGLRVVAWNTASHFKGTSLRRDEVGRHLEADAVLEGSVRKAPGRVRIAAALIDTRTTEYLWSESYDRQDEDLLQIQEEIATAIVQLLHGRFVSAVSPPVLRRPNFDSYSQYLKGRFFWNKRTREGLLASIGFYERALQLEPACAAAHAGIADSYSLLAQFGMLSAASCLPKARAAAERALAADPTLAEAHASLGLITSIHDWDWETGDRHFQRAIALNPGYATAHHWYASDHLAIRGNFHHALEEIDTALMLDPLSDGVIEGRPYILLLARRLEESLAQYEELFSMTPHYYRVFSAAGRVCSLLGRYQEALELFERSRQLAGDLPHILGAMGQTLGWAGRREEARQLLRRLHEMSDENTVSSNIPALVHLGLGEKTEALDWLERGAAGHELPMVSLGVHPAYDALRTEPRFQDLLRRIGLS